MDRLWSYHRPSSVRHVLEDLRRDREIAYTTVMTVMDKLYKKGLLRRQPQGKAYIYEPLITKEAYTAQQMRESLARSGNQAATLAHFLERLNPEESKALAAALQVFPLPGRES
ncbi:CopY family transcriptional regulator [[Actinomadura] parvosata subsp. kistnae]|uniref:CopY family transcriptional regulator n=2 Tax=Nonomuraea TaxID=83681 RepID=A0A1V0AJR8_9ACTN|nr:CopY family transcriptional regulator [Nonomuraea sp. ATCC 55076]